MADRTISPDRDGKPVRHYGKLAKVGLVWGFVREWAKLLVLLPTSMVIARLLTPEEAGVAAAAYFFTQLGGRLTQFGFGAALVRAKTLRPEHVSSVFLMNVAMGVTAWLTLTLLAPAAGAFFRSPETAALLPTAALVFIIMSLATVPTALLSRDMRYRESSTSEWLATIVDSGVSIGLAYLGFSFWSLVYGTLAGDVVRTLCRMWMTRWMPQLRFSVDAAKEMFSFGAGIYARNLLEYAAQNVDNLIVGRTLGIASLGVYDKAFSTMSKLTSKINLAGPSVSFRIFALIHEEPERFRRAYRKVMLSCALVAYPVFTALAVMAWDLVDVLFGEKWRAASGPFQILCLVGLLRMLNSYASTATQAKGQIWAEVKRQILYLCTLVGAVLALSPWGVAGAAAGVLLSTLLMTVMLQRLIRQLADLTWSDLLLPQVPGFVCALGVAVLIFVTRLATNGVADGSSFIRLGICSGVACAFCLLFVLYSPFPAVREVVHETVEDLFPAIGRRLPGRSQEVSVVSGR